jgi:SAM-dependent methyltransferase
MTKRCVACGSSSWSSAGAWKGYRLAVCGRCGLTFTLNPDYSAARYAGEYEGTTALDGPAEKRHGFIYSASAKRLDLETRAYIAPAPRLTPAQAIALRRLKAAAPAGSLVMDCGCGSGSFLWALRTTGLDGVGVEVSPLLVDLLARRGLRAIHGAAPDFPWKDRQPYAITLFEVLEHFPDPSKVIGALKIRFPRARIIASVPSPFRAELFLHRRRGMSDLPPNHFLRWTPKALETFFLREGYAKVKVLIPSPVGTEFFPGVGQILPGACGVGRAPTATERTPARPDIVRRITATAVLWLQRGYQASMDVIGAPRAFLARARGASAGSMLVIAE